jgi:endogenous inhibitor of DNA gyrase (YacG/DUF329 family)
MKDAKRTDGSASLCPTCRKPTVRDHRPFCSKRCADIDLARWLGGTFVIAGAAPDLSDDSTIRAGDEGMGDMPTAAGRDD